LLNKIITTAATLAVLGSFAAAAEKSPRALPDAPTPVAANAASTNSSEAVRVPVNAVVAPAATQPKRFGPGSKALLFLRNSYSPRVFLSGAFSSGVPSIPTEPTQPAAPAVLDDITGPAYDSAMTKYGDDMQAWRDTTQEQLRWRARKFAAGMAEAETQNFLANFAFPTILRQDPRYHVAGSSHSVAYRLGYALSRVAVAPSDSGRMMPNASLWLGTATAAEVGNAFIYPRLGVSELRGGRHMGKTIGANIGLDAVMNVAHEFISKKKND
jgi:hypothetical protein